MTDKVLFLLTCIMFSGCQLIDYHPYDCDTNLSGINKKNIELIEAVCKDKSTVRFVWMGDTQRWYDETRLMVNHINKRSDIDFVMHGGDISDFGMTMEFGLVHREMAKLSVPYVALIGNHDVLGTGFMAYNTIYGDPDFFFIAGDTRFVCINTNALEFDYSISIPDFSFLKTQADLSFYNSRTILAMHVKPYDDQFNNNVVEPFRHYLGMFNNLELCIHAHNHRIEETDVYNDGLVFYGCSSMKERSYMVFTLTPDGYEKEIVYF